jgi:hypothetical protein
MATYLGCADPNDRSTWFWPRPVPSLASAAQAAIDLAVCSGVVPAHQMETGKVYSNTAYVPHGRWEPVVPPAPKATAGGLADGWTPRCGIFRLPGFDQQLWSQLSTLERTDAERFKLEMAQFSGMLVAVTSLLFGAAEQPLVLGTTADRGDELTVTFDNDRANYPGLHLDSWDSGDLDAREHSRTRLCINFGPGDRYLLYVPLTMRQIEACLPKPVADIWREDASQMIHEFFRNHRDAPVARLLVTPGCGYIADTDNMVHDGSTMTIRDGNVHFTVIGRYRALAAL